MQIVSARTVPSTLTEFEAAADRLEALETMPVVAQKLLALTAADDYAMNEVHELVASDPAIASQLLKVASSPAYSPRPVTNLRAAIVRVGMRDLRKLVLTSSMVGAQKMSSFRRQVWERSLRCGALCESLAAAALIADLDDPFLCGLLHDFGILAMDQIAGSAYREVAGEPDEAQAERERLHYGFDHCDIGAMVAAKWNLFPALEAVVQLHHCPLEAAAIGLEASSLNAVFLVALARCFAIGDDELAEDGEPSPLAVALSDKLGMSSADLELSVADGIARFENIYAHLLG